MNLRTESELEEGTRSPSDDASEEVPVGGSVEKTRELSEKDLKTIDMIIKAQESRKAAGEQIREDTKALAKRLGLKTKDVNEIIKMTVAERDARGIIDRKRLLLTLADQAAG